MLPTVEIVSTPTQVRPKVVVKDGLASKTKPRPKSGTAGNPNYLIINEQPVGNTAGRPRLALPRFWVAIGSFKKLG